MKIFERPVAELPGLGWTPRLDSRFAVRSVADATRSLRMRTCPSKSQAELLKIQAADLPILEEMNRIIDQIADEEPDFQLVQIGAHNGNFDDPFVERIKQRTWSADLVEPQTKPFQELAARYANNPNVDCVHAAIGLKAGKMTLWRAELDTQSDFGSAIASTDPDQVRSEVKRNLGSAAARTMQLISEEVPVITLGDLFDHTGTLPDNITLFATDTEGYDAKIVSNLVNDHQARPPLIQWEHLHVDPVETAELNADLAGMRYNLFQTHKDTLAYL